MNLHKFSAKEVKMKFLDPDLHKDFNRLRRAGSTFANLAGAGKVYTIFVAKY